MCFLRNDYKNQKLLNAVETIHVANTVENHHFFLDERITKKQNHRPDKPLDTNESFCVSKL